MKISIPCDDNKLILIKKNGQTIDVVHGECHEIILTIVLDFKLSKYIDVDQETIARGSSTCMYTKRR